MTVLRAVGMAFALYSRIPVPPLDWESGARRYTLYAFPLVGLAVGGGLLLWTWLAGALGLGQLLWAAGMTAIPLLITGGIHLDGFCDVCDALASHQSRERKLEILKDSHTGAFAIICCGLYLLVRGHMQLSTFVPYLAVCVLVPWLLPNLNELPALSAPWEYVRQRIYLEKYILLSGSMLFGGIFLACEPVVQPNRWSSRLIYGLFLGAMATAFRYYSVYETGVCFAVVLAGAFPEWLDRLAQRAERIRFMRKEEKRLAQHREP